MKLHWILFSLIILFHSDNYISINEQKINWFNSLLEGDYVDGDSSTRIKKNENGNITITSKYRDSFCSMEYDTTGSFVSSWSGTILTSK